MMKKRKNMQFFAAAALTATLITGQFTYVPVMAGSTAEVEVSSLIPDNVTVAGIPAKIIKEKGWTYTT